MAEQMNEADLTEVRQAALRRLIYREVETERAQQNEQWGGPDHDDTLSWWDWTQAFRKQLAYADRAGFRKEYREVHRQALVKLAALCVAVIEVMDRKP